MFPFVVPERVSGAEPAPVMRFVLKSETRFQRLNCSQKGLSLCKAASFRAFLAIFRWALWISMLLAPFRPSTFRIESTSGTGTVTVHAEGGLNKAPPRGEEAVRDQQAKETKVDLEELRARVDEVVPTKDVYAAIDGVGLYLGPMFQTAKQLWRKEPPEGSESKARRITRSCWSCAFCSLLWCSLLLVLFFCFVCFNHVHSHPYPELQSLFGSTQVIEVLGRLKLDDGVPNVGADRRFLGLLELNLIGYVLHPAVFDGTIHSLGTASVGKRPEVIRMLPLTPPFDVFKAFDLELHLFMSFEP